MNRDKAITWLKGGPSSIRKWNDYRDRNPSFIPDFDDLCLMGVDLTGANLRGASLEWAIFVHVNLAGVNLAKAHLGDARLDMINLNGADLTEAQLIGAHLPDAKLNGAKLIGANLREVDLKNAHLIEADLQDAHLLRAQLYGAQLSKSNLARAHLAGANLKMANLKGANLEWVDLNGANLDGAQLGDANLKHADLQYTNLTRVDLSRTDLKFAKCANTIFGDVDLSQALGLDKIVHEGPSTVGMDTLFKANGRIPEVFLRGCGVQEAVIVHLPSLIGSINPIQFYSCFLSHSSADKEFARRIYSRMRDEGLRVWFDEFDMQSGRKIHEQIDEAIRLHDKLLIVLSEASIDSEWVETEIRKAFKQERKEGRRKLFPIGLVPLSGMRDWKCFDADHGRDLADEVREYFIPDFANWKDHDAFEAGFALLLRDLKVEDLPAK